MRYLPCIDSPVQSARLKEALFIRREDARARSASTMESIARGSYVAPSGLIVPWGDAIEHAVKNKLSIRPDEALPAVDAPKESETSVQVRNETTLQAAHGLAEKGLRPLALNFANGETPGGGFLTGSRAQEEGLCRSSALYATLQGDPMYASHAARPEPDSSDWMILSPDVPVFRDDTGATLEQFWLLDFLTAAAPYAPTVGQPRSGDLLEQRIRRVLAIAAAYGYRTLVLGAWGCGAFRNDPERTAQDFHNTLENEFQGRFEEVIFAITDWSPERRTLGPFRDEFR